MPRDGRQEAQVKRIAREQQCASPLHGTAEPAEPPSRTTDGVGTAVAEVQQQQPLPLQQPVSAEWRADITPEQPSSSPASSTQFPKDWSTYLIQRGWVLPLWREGTLV